MPGTLENLALLRKQAFPIRGILNDVVQLAKARRWPAAALPVGMPRVTPEGS